MMDLSSAKIFPAAISGDENQICTQCYRKFDYWVLPTGSLMYSFNLPCGCCVGAARTDNRLTKDEVAYLMLRAP